MASSHLARALGDLRSERIELDRQLQALKKRLVAVDTAIDSIAALVTEDSKPLSESIAVFDIDRPLRALINQVLIDGGPKTPRQIADALLDLGYETKSQDFANVVGSQLRATPEFFQKTEDGRWEAIESTL